jgi:hypothetical protein
MAQLRRKIINKSTSSCKNSINITVVILRYTSMQMTQVIFYFILLLLLKIIVNKRTFAGSLYISSSNIY